MSFDNFMAKGQRLVLVIAGSWHQYRSWCKGVGRHRAGHSRFVERTMQLLGYDPDTTVVVFYGTYLDNPVMQDPNRIWERYPYQIDRDGRRRK